MNITSWYPFREMDDFFRSYNRALTSGTQSEGQLTASWRPTVDITENDDEFLIKAELPEVNKDEIEVNVSNGVLTLSGERKSENKDEKEHRIERYYGKFSRSFSLPENVDQDSIKAEGKDGMLYLHLPKTKAEQPRQIQIDVK